MATSKIVQHQDRIEVTCLTTRNTKRFEGTMMVAPNGMVFIKSDGRTIWASAATTFEAALIG